MAGSSVCSPPSAVEAIDAVARRGMALVVDGEGPGDLVMAAEDATPERVAFLVRHTSGVVCAALTDERGDALALREMAPVDHGATATGVSPRERAVTLRALAGQAIAAGDLRRPGRFCPLRARTGGVLERPGRAEAAIDLPRLAGRRPVAVLAQVVVDGGGDLATLPDLVRVAAQHDVPIVSIDDLRRHRLRSERLVERVEEVRMPTRYGEFRCSAWVSALDGCLHLALVLGEVTDGKPVTTRVHAECLLGDALGSLACDCAARLDAALRRIADEGRGVVVYLRGPEGRSPEPCHGRPVPGVVGEGIATQILAGLGVGGVSPLADEPSEAPPDVEALLEALLDG